MKVLIQNIIDVTDHVINAGRENCNFDSFNFVLPGRDILLTDSKGLLSPFAPGGILSPSVNGWKNSEVKILDSDGVLEYTGLIQDVQEENNQGEKIITLKTVNTLGALLSFGVEENDKATYSDFLIDGNHGKGTSKLKIKGGSGQIPDISVMSTDTSLTPSYQILTAKGEPSSTITLDRPITNDLLDNTPLIISVPISDTPATFLKRAIKKALAKINQSERIDESSFDEIDVNQAAIGFYLFVYIRKEDKINLNTHINTLMEIGNVLLTEEDGKIKLVSGFSWDGLSPIKKITEAEIIEPESKIREFSRAIFGYNCLWKNGDKIENKFDEIGPEDPAIRDSNAIHPWTPIGPKGVNVIGHNYLFIDEPTAKRAGDDRLFYYKYSRTQVLCSLTMNFENGNPINIKQFDRFLLNLSVSDTESYENEPVLVLAYEKNEESLKIENVIMELINTPTPGLSNPTQ